MSNINPIYPNCHVLNPEEISDSSRVGSIRHELKIRYFRCRFNNVSINESIPTRFVIKYYKEQKTRLFKLYRKYNKI